MRGCVSIVIGCAPPGRCFHLRASTMSASTAPRGITTMTRTAWLHVRLTRVRPTREEGQGAVPKIAVCGGPYANPHALAAMLEDARGRGCERIFCLGDL